ncbi:MAG TPA: DUF262 domain-containing protein [Patescibacteria group bacterium]|jgi:uncharacterized protein with ParB-like and HNH nuclease domain|nr:DUF262 domain-containing protein [Patescibacteria group bacterium]
MTAKNKMPRKIQQTFILDDKRSGLFVSVKDFANELIYTIDIDADYQREEVWSKNAKEKLIDSIIKGIDIPKLYLFELENGKQNFKYECIDGKQRMLALFQFFHPDTDEDEPLKAEVRGKKYTYEKLSKELREEAKRIEDYLLEFIVYKEGDDLSNDFIREIFQRLQLGTRLNSGEILNAHTGIIRDFIFKDKKKKIPFLDKTGLSQKRYSKQFTLAQICINSINRAETDSFTRARLLDLEEFFNRDIDKIDNHFKRISKVLEIMDHDFGHRAEIISSRAVAVSAYLFVEDLYGSQKLKLIPKFAEFYEKLLDKVKDNLALMRNYDPPRNKAIIDEFQKYISQASVEKYSLNNRDKFLKKAFQHYLNPKTKGQIIEKTNTKGSPR